MWPSSWRPSSTSTSRRRCARAGCSRSTTSSRRWAPSRRPLRRSRRRAARGCPSWRRRRAHGPRCSPRAQSTASPARWARTAATRSCRRRAAWRSPTWRSATARRRCALRVSRSCWRRWRPTAAWWESSSTAARRSPTALPAPRARLMWCRAAAWRRRSQRWRRIPSTASCRRRRQTRSTMSRAASRARARPPRCVPAGWKWRGQRMSATRHAQAWPTCSSYWGE
mmetsp:Transcript_76272/g.228863  ORF Transcript_76272/g.228863 Transcript_76272/m.228863 type:complete len:225 (-) Transcript_76272:253-927(-)